MQSFWQIIILSFYSSDLYLSVANKWQHWGLKFLLRFSVLASCVSSIFFFIFLSSVDFSSNEWLINFPTLKIENDQASSESTDINLPFTVKHPATGLLITVDMNISDTNKPKSENAIIFTKDKIIFAANGGFSAPYHNLFPNASLINANNIIELLQNAQQKLLNIILFLGVPIGSLLYFFITLFGSFIYAAMARVVSRLFNYNLSFKQLTRLAIIANTPAFLIQTMLFLLLFDLRLSSNLAQIVYLFYFTYAFITASRKS